MRREFISQCLATMFLLHIATSSGLCQEIEEVDLNLPVLSDTCTRDWQGLKRDTWYFLGYQWVTIAVLYAAPESVSGWTDERKKNYDLSQWSDNATHAQMDSDDLFINYVLHPYWGAAYFVRARERGYDSNQAFWYSAMLSTMYEFGAEALFEEPSIQDLIVTPVFGSMLGRYFWKVRSDIREREIELGYRTTKDKWLWVLTDPLGSLNRQVDRLFGRDTHLQIRSYRRMAQARNTLTPAPFVAESDVAYGLEFRLEW